MVFLVSADPIVTVSYSSYINQIIEDAGGINIYKDLKRPYPVISIESLIKRNPDIIISMTDVAKSQFKEKLASMGPHGHTLIKRIIRVSPDYISSYTPADYIKAVEKISAIIFRTGKE